MALTLLILALALGTYALRFLPLTALSRVNLPEWALDWLSLVPGAVLAASLAQTLLIQEEQLALSWSNAYLLAALPTFVIAWRTRSVILTMLVGMASYALLQNLL
ncbi:MAG: AzlD domain-containing protein [Anaerolineae bacterium]